MPSAQLSSVFLVLFLKNYVSYLCNEGTTHLIVKLHDSGACFNLKLKEEPQTRKQSSGKRKKEEEEKQKSQITFIFIAQHKLPLEPKSEKHLDT